MLKCQFLTATHPEDELIKLLLKMKESNLGIFQDQKKLALDYSRNIFSQYFCPWHQTVLDSGGLFG